jgi:hypothetical protein
MFISLKVNNKGQAIAELAIFGSLLLFLFGVFLSYAQRLNDQQYVQMETFRRTLEKACTTVGTSSEGAGASAQMTLIQHRRNVGVTGGFRNGNASTASASSSVFWAVPRTGRVPENRLFYRINDEESGNMDGEKIEDINISSESNYGERLRKQETPVEITTYRQADQTETITTSLVTEAGTPVWEVTQGLYKDDTGQYRYNSAAAGTPVTESRKWETPFGE